MRMGYSKQIRKQKRNMNLDACCKAEGDRSSMEDKWMKGVVCLYQLRRFITASMGIWTKRTFKVRPIVPTINRINSVSHTDTGLGSLGVTFWRRGVWGFLTSSNKAADHNQFNTPALLSPRKCKGESSVATKMWKALSWATLKTCWCNITDDK